MNKPTVSGNFTVEDIHNIREWNYEMMKSGKGFADTNTVSDIIQSFPKAKYVPLHDFMMEPSPCLCEKR
ncbi:hypothetical protein [Treponema sp. Marseille-Q4132]|uniref:hypothetical protein n=1 Tax=Treponema sp. Marseille-Q4132 TaxID=2766701 RepID=UPI001653340D|nr:hypothetical protein [Treponema sp. Marseille-Q4132]QNL96688.1 hypothetical protein H9I35_09620 [Treponema sp. Marseille-Q4132]